MLASRLDYARSQPRVGGSSLSSPPPPPTQKQARRKQKEAPPPAANAAAVGPASNLLFENAMEGWLKAHPHMHMLGRARLSQLSQLSGAVKEKERRDRRRRARNAASAAPSSWMDQGARRRYTPWGKSEKKKKGSKSGKTASGDRKNGGATSSPASPSSPSSYDGEKEERFGASPGDDAKKHSSPSSSPAPPPPPSQPDYDPLERVLKRIEMRKGAAAYTRQHGLSGVRELSGRVPRKPPDPSNVDEAGVLVLPANRKKQVEMQMNVLMESMQRAGDGALVDEALEPNPRSVGPDDDSGSNLARGLYASNKQSLPNRGGSSGNEAYMSPRDRADHTAVDMGELFGSMEMLAGRAVID